ncbi:MAG TPA: hypothetical protein VGD67_13810 [Pseudonocardiaceae bacterium]
MRSEDLAPLFGGDPPGLTFHQGTILTWNAQTGQNTVAVAGAVLTDVPMAQQGPEALTIRAGQVVTLLGWRSSFWILGRVATPGSGAFFSGAMPNVVTNLFPLASDAATQQNQTGGAFKQLWAGGMYVHHRYLSIDVAVRVSGGTAVGSYRSRWTTTLVGTPTYTDIDTLTGVTAATPQVRHTDYEWPPGMRGQLVYVVFEGALTAGVNGVDWIHTQPIGLNCHD